MIKSMTGYGKAECELPNKKITIEIKSLNSKQLDINSRFPGVYREKDVEVRKMLAEKLVRGKVEFNLYCEQMGDETNATVNKSIVSNYYKQLIEVYNDLDLEISERIIHTIMRLPDAVKIEHEALDEEEWKQIRSAIAKAIDMLDGFRLQEGEAMDTDIKSHIKNIIELKKDVSKYEEERIEQVKNKLKEALNELSSSIQADQNRYEQELIYYLEKLDINEEQVRLENHCKYFIQSMNESDVIGKKLGFISQEIGREINTMGSKANHAEIQKLVIKMKDELEKVKEQTLNVL